MLPHVLKLHRATAGNDSHRGKDPMSELDGDIQRQACPILTDEQIALLRPLGQVQATKAGDVLVAAGDATYALVVVLRGATTVVDRSEGSDQLLPTTGPG